MKAARQSMLKESNILPPQYTPVEYLQSTNGNQFITTEISTNDIGRNGRFVVKVVILSLRNRFMGYINGVYGSDGDIVLATTDSQQTSIPYFYLGWHDYSISDFNCRQTTPYVIDYQFSDGMQKIYADGRLLNTGNSSGWHDSSVPHNIMIFRAQSSYLGSTQIYRCQIYQADDLIGDFLPVRKGDVGMMYDLVTKHEYVNQGTGSFIYGRDLINIPLMNDG